MESAPALDDCLKLLRGERDEQRLAGLLLATKFCKGDDNASILRVYNAVGPRFLDRLLMTGMGKGTQSVKGGEDRESYLRLSVTVLAALCRVPEIASSEDMVSKVPIVLEIISKSSDKSIFEECFEFLFLVATTSIDGLTRLYEAGVISVLASHTSTIPNDIYEGSRAMELAMKLLQLIFSRLPLEVIYMKYHSEISCLVVTIARQFAMMQNALKFDALHLLTTILSSAYAVALYDLRSMSSESWAAYIRIGMVAILQNRVASFDKLQALILAESMMSILGENWLLDHRNVPGNQNPMSADKCLLLVLESARIEVAVLLNELAYLKYETSKNPSADAETIVLKQRNLAISYSVIEKIIKLISNVCGVEGCPITDDTTTKVISGLNETTGLVLDYLQDAKDHGQRKGDDLLASVRIVGSYLAETPFACKEKVQDLMEYILSVEGEDEMSPFYSVCFMLPMLCQTTMDINGCKALASFGGHKAVVDYLVKLIGPSGATVGDNGTIFLACDTIMNLLLNREEISAQLEESHFIHLLHALAFWAEESNDETVIMMATSLSSLIFDITSEEALLKHAAFELHTLESLSQLFARSLDANAQAKRRSDSVEEQMDLHHIVMAGYSRWADRFPLVKKAVERRA